MNANAGADSAPEDEATRLLDLLQANENLVLSALHAHELAEEAESATERVEAALGRSEQMGRELEENERVLRATGQRREEMIGIVGHDLRNPLTAIQMLTGRLARKGALDPDTVEMVRRISRSVDRMKGLVTQLVEFTGARLGGGVVLDRGPADLRLICRVVVEELEVNAPGRFRCQLTGDLCGSWDHHRLAEAISNIAGNASEYALPGTPILVRAWGDAAWVRLEVSNQGPPIPADVLPTLFEPFRRGRAQPGMKSGHLGLGLYIAQQIVVAHGGALTAWSADGSTTFAMRLPSPAAHDPNPATSQPVDRK